MTVREGAITVESLKVAYWKGVATGGGITLILSIISIYLGSL